MDWPVVGRDSILRRLTSVLMATNGTWGIEIVGEAGVGKTRLSAELVRMLRQNGRATETVVASGPMRDIPFGALAHLIRDPSALSNDLFVLATLLRELGSRGDQGQPLVVLVDDVHLMDERSAALLRQLVTRREGMLILTRRTDEASPRALTELWSGGSLVRIELEPLTEDESQRLLEAALDGRVDPLTAQEIWQRSQGNPLFIRELVEAGLEKRVLKLGAAGWHADGELRLPSRLVELIEDRIGRLSSAERRAASLLAVSGTLGLASLEQLARPAAVSRLERRGLMEVARAGNRREARLAHPLYAEAMLQRLPATSRRRLLRSLAANLESTGARRSHDLIRLAVWRLDGGAPRRPGLLSAAAGRALASFDAVLAERLARAAIRPRGGDLQARLVLGEALAAQQRIEEADKVLRLAMRRARNDDEIVRTAVARANLLFFRAGRFPEAVMVLEAAVRRLTDADSQDEIDSMLALMRSGAGDLPGVAEVGSRLARRPRARPRAVVNALVYSSIAAAMLGRQSEAIGQVEIGLGLAPEVREELPFAAHLLQINATISACYDGRLAEGRALAEAGYRAAIQSGAADLSALWATALAELLLIGGDLHGALATLLSALTVVRQRDPFFVRGIDTALSSTVASQLGEREQAGALWHEATENGLDRDVRSRIQLERAGVWLTAGRGDLERAAAEALIAGQLAVSGNHRVWALFCFHDAVRFGHAKLVVDQLTSVAAGLEGRLAEAIAMHARAAAVHDGRHLEDASRSFEAIGAYLLAAEAAAQAQIAHQAAGNARQAGLSTARAALLAARCTGARTPALLETTPVALTARERQVARFAREGLSSPTIALRMQISVRTVDNHLASIYAKLGISTRSDLPSVLGIGARPGTSS